MYIVPVFLYILDEFSLTIGNMGKGVICLLCLKKEKEATILKEPCFFPSG